MPIEFPCPNCGTRLRTPDDAAGGKARCPNCDQIATVPQQQPDDPPSPFEAPASNPFSDPQAAPTPLATSNNPYASLATESSLYTPSTTPREGLPWEREPKSLKCFWRTAKMILMSPSAAFGVMLRNSELGAPFGFALVGSLIGGLATAIFTSLFQAAMLGFAMVAGGEDAAAAGAMIGMQIVMNFTVGFIAGVVGTIIGVCIGAAINHLMLWLLGGAHHGFEVTLRVAAYTAGTVALLRVVPLCGPMVQGIANIVYMILGLRDAHETTGGKAALAVLLPIAICMATVAAVVGVIVYFAVQSAGGF